MKHMTKKFPRFLRILGPGLVTGAADDDPSGIATYSQAGARFGFGLLWAFPIMYPLLLAVQESCSRIGAVTGKGLARVIKEHYARPVLGACVFLVVIANTINIGSDLGAMAATLQLFFPLLPFWLLCLFFAIIVLLLVMLVPYKTYANMLKWLALALLAYPVTAFLIGQDWQAIIRATFLTQPHINFETAYMLVGMIGTTVSPYLFFWDTSQVVEEEIESHRLSKNHTPRLSKTFLKHLRVDNFIGMTLASLTAWFIVIVTGSILFANGITDIHSAEDAARALEPLVSQFPNAGLIAKMIFSFGIIGLGLLAIPTLAGSASYAVCETMGWKEGLHQKFKRAHGFYFVMILATFVGLLINFVGINPMKALIFTAVFNGIAAFPLLFMIAHIGNNKAIMGEHKNGRVSNFFVRLAALIMMGATFFLFFTWIVR